MNIDTADSSRDLPMPVAVPSISRNPSVAIPVLILVHGPLDFLTAYWMMSVRGPEVEWNRLAVAAFEYGPLAYAAFAIGGTAFLAAVFWYGRDLWQYRWMPVVAEILLLIGVFGAVLANTLAALGVAF